MFRYWGLLLATICVASTQACDANEVGARGAVQRSAFDRIASANKGDGAKKGTPYGFARGSVGRGVSVELPKSFRVLNNAERELIKTAGSAAVDQVGWKPSLGDNLIRANSSPATSYASISITSVIPASVSYQEARSVTPKDAASLTTMMKQGTVKLLDGMGVPLLSFYGVRLEHFGNYPAIVHEYERGAADGRSVIVQVNTIFTPRQEVRFTLSYRKSEAPMWRPILAKVRSSLVIN